MNRRTGHWLVATSLSFGLALASFQPAANAAVLANWTFETAPPTNAGPHAADGGILGGAASGSHASTATVYDNPSGNGSTESFSSNNWAVGDFWQFRSSTTGFQNVTLQWDQTSSNTGPRDFQVSWSTDGTTFTPLGAPYAVLANAAPNPTWNPTTSSPLYTSGPIAAPPALDNQATIYFRLTNTSTVSANGGTVAATGTDRIDNVIISGTAIPEPASLGLLAGAGLALRRRRRRA